MARFSYSLRLHDESCLKIGERIARERNQETDSVHSLLYTNPSHSSCNFLLSFSHHSHIFFHCNALPHVILLAMLRSSLHHFRMFNHCIAPRDYSYNSALVLFLSFLHIHSLHCLRAFSLQFLSSLRYFRMMRTVAAHSDILIRSRLSKLFSRFSNRSATCLATDKCPIAVMQDVG